MGGGVRGWKQVARWKDAAGWLDPPGVESNFLKQRPVFDEGFIIIDEGSLTEASQVNTIGQSSQISAAGGVFVKKWGQ